MRRTKQTWTAFILIFFLALATRSQANPPTDNSFSFLGYDVSEELVSFRYEIRFGGMVELRLYTEEEELVYRNQYINRRGENQIRLKTRAFEPGKTYIVELNYKKSSFRKDFVIPQ